MSEERIPIGIDFERVLETISKQIYDTPMAFLRENVQNAIDAIRMLQVIDDSFEGRVDITIHGNVVRIRDNGVGMSKEDLQQYFWTIGSSGKNTPLAKRAGCIGTFGIGGFANFGVCDRLTVVSKKK